MKPVETDQEIRGWVLYDASCPLCLRSKSFLERQLGPHGFLWEPLQSSTVRERISAGDDDLRREMHLLLSDGRHLAGPDAYRHLLSHLWWGKPLAALCQLPFIKQIFDTSCRAISRNRHALHGKLA